MRLHALVHLGVVEVLALMDKGLPYLVQCGIVQVLGLERRFIDDRLAWVTFAQSHVAQLIASCSPLAAVGCYCCILLHILLSGNDGLLSSPILLQ